MSQLLPIDWEDKVNSPELLAYLQQFGYKTYLSAEEINQIKEAINFLYKQARPDEVLKLGEITTGGLEVFVEANSFEWRINQVEFLITPDFYATLTAASPGYYRKDVLLGTDTGGYEIVTGVEDPLTATEPNIFAPGRIKLGIIDVYGTIINGYTPVELAAYATKQYVNDADSAILSLSKAYTDSKVFTSLAFNTFKLIQKGVDNTNLTTNEIGDIFCGWSNDRTIRIHEAIWLGGSLQDSDNFKPLSQTGID